MIHRKVLLLLIFLQVFCKGYGAKVSIPMGDIMKAVNAAEKVVEKKYNSMDNPGIKHPKFRGKSLPPACAMAGKVSRATNTTKDINRIANVMELATIELVEKYNQFPKPEVLEFLKRVSLPKGSKEKDELLCPNSIILVKCDEHYPFRSSTGFCNNLDKPYLGSAYSVFPRILQNAYQDGIRDPRSTSKNGGALPSPRDVSLKVHLITSRLDSDHTHMLMLWGQFTDHDITLTPTAFEQSVCSPCDTNGQQNDDCFPIKLSSSDPIFGGVQTCMTFVRSARGNELGFPREAVNQISSYIDASNVYSSGTYLLMENAGFKDRQYLRAFSDGKLEITDKNLMPPAPFQGGCTNDGGNTPCFLAGDIRNSEHMGLASMQTLWVREHNYIAGELKRINGWDDDRLFLETRRIIGALHQRITYNEFLPTVIGQPLMMDLEILEENPNNPDTPDGYFMGYNSSCDATIFTEFATAAFRFGHSLVDGYMKVKINPAQNYSLSRHFFNPAFLYMQKGPTDQLLGLLIGATEQENQANDRFINEVIRNHLFQTGSTNDGFDLAALNIQRGRDHGLPPYTTYRHHFTNESIPSFEHLMENNIMDNDTVQALMDVYASVDDIDLWTGIVSELPVHGGVVGLVGAHIIGEQFKNLKHCDRFFYSNGQYDGITSYFTKDQLKEIRKMSLSHVLCRQAENLNLNLSVRTRPMKKLACRPEFNIHTNCEELCKNYQYMDLEKWRTTDPLPTANFVSKNMPRGRCIAEQRNSADFGAFYV